MAKRILGVGSLVGAVAAATLGAAVGCGDGFASSDDCHTRHTCTSAAGVGGASDGNDPGGAGGAGESDSPTLGGAAATAGASGEAGAGGVSGCRVDAECSNDNAEDGAEICDDGTCLPGNPPPTIVSVTPESDAVDIELDTTVAIEFSEPLDPKTVTAGNIRVQDGTTVVPGTLAYEDGKVTFKPSAPLALLASYTLYVTTGIKDADGAPLIEALASTFSTRDGAWHEAINVAKDTRGVLSDVLPMTAEGNALVVWTGTAESYCPAWGRSFLRGVAPDAAKSLAITGQTECNFVSSGGNATGVNAVTWSEPDASNGTDVAQFRDGAWLAKPALVSANYSADRLRVAVAPSGVVTLFEHVPGISKAWTTDAKGTWPVDGDVISTFTAQGRTSVAFHQKGDGIALWRAKDPLNTKLQRIMESRFSAAGGEWSTAVDLPGSVTATSDDAQRGTPVVAVDSNGGAMALWVDSTFTSKLRASRYDNKNGWAQPEVISGALAVDVIDDAPGLTFDGQAFVAAWVALDAGERYTYTARYDLTTGWSPYDKQQTSAADGTSAARMPRLVSDGRGNLLLVFAQGSGTSFTLASQRYASGAWSPISPVPGGAVTQLSFENSDILPLSMSANGLAALAWTNYDSVNFASTVRLASFY